MKVSYKSIPSLMRLQLSMFISTIWSASGCGPDPSQENQASIVTPPAPLMDKAEKLLQDLVHVQKYKLGLDRNLLDHEGPITKDPQITFAIGYEYIAYDKNNTYENSPEEAIGAFRLVLISPVFKDFVDTPTAKQIRARLLPENGPPQLDLDKLKIEFITKNNQVIISDIEAFEKYIIYNPLDQDSADGPDDPEAQEKARNILKNLASNSPKGVLSPEQKEKLLAKLQELHSPRPQPQPNENPDRPDEEQENSENDNTSEYQEKMKLLEKEAKKLAALYSSIQTAQGELTNKLKKNWDGTQEAMKVQYSEFKNQVSSFKEQSQAFFKNQTDRINGWDKKAKEQLDGAISKLDTQLSSFKTKTGEFFDEQTKTLTKKVNNLNDNLKENFKKNIETLESEMSKIKNDIGSRIKGLFSKKAKKNENSASTIIPKTTNIKPVIKIDDSKKVNSKKDAPHEKNGILSKTKSSLGKWFSPNK